MAGPFTEKIYGVAIKIETTSGVDAVPDPLVNAIRMVGIPTLQPAFMDEGEREDEQTGVMSGAGRTLAVGSYGTIDLPIRMKGAGAVYSASVKPEADPLWRMSGCPAAGTFTGGAEQYLYKTADAGFETGSCYFWSANKLYKMVGCVAKPKLSAAVYGFGDITFSIQGKIIAITETALPTLGLSSALPPKMVSAAAAIGSWTTASTEPLMLLAASLDLGTAVGDLSSAGATDGLAGFLITNRQVTQELTFNAPSLTAYNPFAQAGLDDTAALITAWQVGSAQYNRVKVEARWSPKVPREASRNGIKTYQQSGICKVGGGLSGGREFQITYY